ncbi:MAG: hypothetical protein Q8P93_04780 [bacterium]|nr:hypothetical protein [bacterium]
MNPDLQNYINQARASGKTDEVIQNELRAAGWGEAELANAFAPVSSVVPLRHLLLCQRLVLELL